MRLKSQRVLVKVKESSRVDDMKDLFKAIFMIVFALSGMAFLVYGYPFIELFVEKDFEPPFINDDYNHYATCMNFFVDHGLNISDAYEMCDHIGVNFGETREEFKERSLRPNPFITVGIYVVLIFSFSLILILTAHSLKKKEER